MKVDAFGLPAKVVDVAVTGPLLEVDVALTLGFTEQVTVGSRVAGAETKKAVPVDIITHEQIASSSYTETAQLMESIAPSFNFPRPTITDGTDTVRPATLRGLGPDQVLVLINGKRRHQSALVHVNGSIGRGSTGVDLNAIPLSTIDHIEVLRDGASAQYGSDAIAGVINIVLKDGRGAADRDGERRPVGGIVRGQPVHSRRSVVHDRQRHRLRRREPGRRRWIVGNRCRQRERHRRGRVSAPRSHQPGVVRSARSDRGRGCWDQRGRGAQPSLGRSRHARHDDLPERERAAERIRNPPGLCVRRI